MSSGESARLPSLWLVFTFWTWRLFQEGPAKFEAKKPHFNINI